MGTYSLDQIQKIVLENPNKEIVDVGKKWKEKLMRHLHGVDIKSAVKRDKYFENPEIYENRKDNAVSNRDLFSRLLQEEELVFSARGGATRFNMQKDSERTMLSMIEDIRYGQSLRKWVKNFALNAYRSDPMGLIFMEVEAVDVEGDNNITPKCYPTYKCIDGVFDYLPNGRGLEYVCFQLNVSELSTYGINDPSYNVSAEGGRVEFKDGNTNHFRFVDDEKDMILKKDNNTVVIASNIPKNPIKNNWDKVPAFIVSDLIQFDSPKCFSSPLQFIIELADCFFYDRSIRDLQKKYHGFAKAVEPLLKCPTCQGEGIIKGSECPSCTIPGQDRGTGYKLQTKVSDKAMFPLSVLENGSFDFKRIFGYITPDIESWDKQDLSLEKMEELMYFTYWGVHKQVQSTGPKGTAQKENTNETATKTILNLQPKYARLNATADWAEKTENMIANYIGQFWFPESFKSSAITYSRSYILELPEDILEDFYKAREKGAPQIILKSLMDKYISALDQGNPLEAERKRKLMNVEPFPYSSIEEVEKSTIIPSEIKLQKWFYNEWESTIASIEVVTTSVDDLRNRLAEYVQSKGIEVEVKEPTV